MNKDVLTHIGMMLDYEDVINLSLRDKKFNRYLSQNCYFWKNKLIQDFNFSVGKLELSKYIYRFLDFVKKIKKPGFFYATVKGNSVIIKELLKDERFNPAADNNYAIRRASQEGHLDVVQELLKDRRVDPSDDYNDAIILASENGHLEVVQELLKDERVDPSDDDNDAIILASENGHLEVVKLLLKDKRVNPAANRNKALRSAAKHGHVEIVKLLLPYLNPEDKN